METTWRNLNDVPESERAAMPVRLPDVCRACNRGPDVVAFIGDVWVLVLCNVCAFNAYKVST